ncbi:MAG: hypothetical protein WDA16_08500 [Candidatus Thermoplasmatota archaeon]
MTTLRWTPIALAIILAGITPLTAADGTDGDHMGCLNIITTHYASGIRPVLSISDAIAVGLQSDVPTEIGAILIIIPSMCQIPPVGDAIGELKHTSQSAPAPLLDPSQGQPILS